MTIMAIFGLMIIMLGLQAFFRRYKWASWITFSILPIVLLPWWMSYVEYELFDWIKTYTVLLGVSWIMALRFTNLREKKWATAFAYMLLFLNILEVVILEVIHGNSANYMNAAAGILLLLSMPSHRLITVDQESPNRDLLWDIPLPWIIGYTIWDLVFVYLRAPEYIGPHIAILGAALIVGVINNRLWILARAYTLGIYLLAIFTYNPIFDRLLIQEPRNEAIASAGAVISLVWMLWYAMRMGRTWLQSREAASVKQHSHLQSG